MTGYCHSCNHVLSFIVFSFTWLAISLLIMSIPLCWTNKLSYLVSHKCYFAWRKHENISLCTGSRVNTNYGRIASWGGCQCWTGDPRILETPLALNCCSQHLDPSVKNRLAPPEWYHTLVTTASRFWAGMILHWAAYTWHWRIDIINVMSVVRKQLHNSL